MGIDELCVNTLRFLAVDAVEKANSGHPGLPLDAAPMAYVLWDRFLRFNPENPSWINRDRFILSPGHGCALLYALLHVYGYDLPMEELKRFREWGSRTPGHPEYGLTPGVEATTGPLGQGFANGVGIAIAEKLLEETFNRPGFPLIDHYTYEIVSDGDLMEGISSEAASLAGTLGLGKMIYLYDDNHVSLEGKTDEVFTTNIRERFESYGWRVLWVPDGNDLEGIDKAIRTARAGKDKPTLIVVRTHIGYGSPKQDTREAHGEPLGEKALKATKENLGWPLEPSFYVPEEARGHFNLAIGKGAKEEKDWRMTLEKYRAAYPDLAAQFDMALTGRLPKGWIEQLPSFKPEEGPMSTRIACGKVMNALDKALHTLGKAPHHFLVGGSADLNPSTKTYLIGYGDFGFSENDPHNIHFGVREHAMGAIVNGLALHSHFIPYGATFLVFSDYMRPPIRLAAMMKTDSIFIFTHDSIALGQDGPTHQPVEQLMGLRSVPGLTVFRPADANETAVAWRLVVERKKPAAMVFTRQSLPILDPQKYPVYSGALRGAYTLVDSQARKPDVILIGTGSEVSLALSARKELESMGVAARVVSMPCWEIFDEQSPEYRQHVLPKDVPKISIEAGVTPGWRKYVGDNGATIGLDRFGESAPGPIVYDRLGFNVVNIVERTLELLERDRRWQRLQKSMTP